MKIHLKLFFIICLVLVFSSTESNAKTFAYLIGTGGEVLKIDTDTDTVVSESKLEKSSYVQSGETCVVADKVNNNLYVVTGRLTPYYIYVYDLKTLKFKKDLGIRTGTPPIVNPDVNILVSPNGSQLFINWYDGKYSGWAFDLYDAKNLSKIRNMGDFTWGSITTFSPDAIKIYVYNGQNDTIQVHETSNFTLLETIDLNTLWRKDVFAQGIEDYKGENILISETEKAKLTDPSKDTLFVYNLKTKASLPRISTGMSGEEILSPDGTKIFLNEKNVVRNVEGSYLYAKTLGRLHTYNVATGGKIGTVLYSVDRDGEIIGIHPNGNKVYILGEVAGEGSLLVLDVVKLSVTNTIKIPSGMFLVFYDE